MKKTLFIFTIVVLAFMADNLSAQGKSSAYTPKINQHSLSFEVASFSYTYSHRFKPNLTLGASVHFGMAFLVQINVMNRLSSRLIDPRIEMSKLQIFYRKYFKANVYSDFGVYYSIGYYPLQFPEGDFMFFAPTERNVGVYFSIFYGHNKIKFGHEVQFGLISEHYYGVDKNKPTLLIVPIIIRYSF